MQREQPYRPLARRHRRQWPRLASLAPLLLLPALAVNAATRGVMESTFEYQLENGLKLVVREDHRAPVVASMVWYRVGSSYEHEGITGVSHVLEHMMFQGTERLPAGEFSRLIAAEGGRENAFTSRDYTAYYQQLEASRLPISFELEADRMRHLQLQAAAFEKERQVVMEERRLRTEDKPSSLAYEQLMAAAFVANPNRRPVIGWMDDLAHLTLDDLAHWYRQWYAPNNAIVVVVGDVDAAAVHALAERHFGSLPAAPLPTTKPRREPTQHGTRELTLRLPAKLPLLMMGYQTPVLGGEAAAWEVYALELLASILDYGDAARLSRELVRGREIAASVGAGYSPYALHDGLLLFEGVPAPDHDLAALEQALLGQVERLRSELVSESELARIRAQVTAAQLFARDSIFYQANLIGKMEALGLGWRTAEHYPAALAAITPEQIREVARRYLTPDRLTIARLYPQPLANQADTP